MPDTQGATYEPDDGIENGWDHRHFARTLGRILGRRAATLAMPKVVMKGASRIDRLVRRERAKLTPDRVRYFCHPDWVVDRRGAPAGLALAARHPHPHRPQGDRRMVPPARLAQINGDTLHFPSCVPRKM